MIRTPITIEFVVYGWFYHCLPHRGRWIRTARSEGVNSHRLSQKLGRVVQPKPPLCKGRCRANARRRDCPGTSCEFVSTSGRNRMLLLHNPSVTATPCQLPLHKGAFGATNTRAFYHSSSPCLLGRTRVRASMATSSMESSGSKVVKFCIHRPGADRMRVTTLSCRPMNRLIS